MGHFSLFSVKRFVTGSRAPQPLHTTFTVSYPAAAMPVASSASAISRMFASVTVASPENWFQLCQCIGGYGAISAAGRGATLAAGAPEAAGAPATDSSAVATRLLMVVAEEFQSSVPDVLGSGDKVFTVHYKQPLFTKDADFSLSSLFCWLDGWMARHSVSLS